MGQPLETHIRILQDFYWSDADPRGRGFVPLADALRRSGDLREAHRVLREGLNRWPDFTSGHVVAAWVARDRGALEDAEGSFRAVLNLDPKNVAALRGLAEILASRGESKLALDCLQDVLQEDPADLSVPARILELREQARVLAAADTAQAEGTSLMVWEDPAAAAEDLDWEKAGLQDDRPFEAGETRDEEQAGGEEAGLMVEDPGPGGVAVEEEEGLHLPESGLGAEASSADDLRDSLVTSTLGDIYLRQGLYGRAEEVFQALLDRDPENEEFAARLQEVERLKRGEESNDSEDSLGPLTRTAPVSIDALAPEVPSIEAFAPEVLSIDALAPEAPSIETLAPEAPGAISVADLAPDVPSIQSLAPDSPAIVSIEALAPDSPDDPTLDAFESWLDKL